jgi:hypothetical protein
MASSSQVRSRAERKTHILSIPFLSASRPVDHSRDFFSALSCAVYVTASRADRAQAGMSQRRRGGTRSAAL